MSRIFKRQAFTLVEMIVYMAVMVIVSALAYRLFYQGWEKSEQFMLASQQIADANRVGDCWRADIRAAKQIKISNDILEMTTKNNAQICYKTSENKLYCRRGAKSKWQLLLKKVKQTHFHCSTEDNLNIWTFDLELKSCFKPDSKTRIFSFKAVNPAAVKKEARREP